MKKTFEKILDRLEEKKQYFQKFYETDGKTEEDENINKATQLAFDDAKSIVKEVAEEYKGGWIPYIETLSKLEERTAFLKDCTKYGNRNAEQQEKSYSTMMMYEVADLVDDLIEIVKAGVKNE